MSTAILTRQRYLVAFVTIALAALAGLFLWLPARAQEVAGFDGYIQSGTCAAPTDVLKIVLEDARGDYAVEPYLAKISGEDATVTLAFYGAPYAPGFGYSTMFSDLDVYSLVITDATTGEPVSCGDLLQPDDENFEQIGMALIQLNPVGDSGLRGYAILERTTYERELDIITTQVRILLSTDAVAIPPASGTPEATPTS